MAASSAYNWHCSIGDYSGRFCHNKQAYQVALQISSLLYCGAWDISYFPVAKCRMARTNFEHAFDPQER